MRDLTELDHLRRKDERVLAHYGWYGDGTCGVFDVEFHPLASLRCIASSGEGWDHVSVTAMNRCPTWGEMEHVKRLFFKPDETVMQLHVPVDDHVNCHPYCLHLWRPNDGREIPRPPARFVA